ncbi:MAG: sortase, partial [Clostridia bacterium]
QNPYAQSPYAQPTVNPYEQAQQPVANPYEQMQQPAANPYEQMQQPTANPYMQQNPYAGSPYAPVAPYPAAYSPYAPVVPMYPQPAMPQSVYGIPQEQMQAIVEQYLKAQAGEKEEAKEEIKAEEKVEEEVAQDARNPKSKIIFQSDDFDSPNSAPTVIRNEPANVDDEDDDSQQKKNQENQQNQEKEEEKRTNLEFKPEVKEDSSILTTDLGEGFSVFEVEISQKELGILSRKHPVRVTALGAPSVVPVVHKNSVMTDENGNVSSFEVEEFEEQELANSISQQQKDFETEFAGFMNMDDDDDDDDDVKKKKSKKSKKSKKKTRGSKKGKQSSMEIVRKLILAVAVLGILGSCGMLGYEYMLSSQNANLEQDLQDLIIDTNTFTTDSSSESDADEDTDEDTDYDDSDDVEVVVMTLEEQWELIYEEYPDVDFPEDMQIEYANLYAINTDFVGYLSADGVGLALSIVQTDNDSEYLSKNFYGASTKYGCPFVTHLNSLDELDQNTIIYGHHMTDGTVFGVLDEYKDIQGFIDAPVITFDTLGETYEWKIIAAFITNVEESDDDGYVFMYYFTELGSEENFATYLSELESRSLYDTGVDVLSTDKIITLSTCSHEFDDARFVVVARLVRAGESSTVDTSLATLNTNVRYPQAYYDENGGTNYYADAYRWYPD